jgi:uncharacterized UPF0160 family protein
MAKTKIVTHSSKFHTDDIFAVATLSLVLGEENIEVVRSRDPEVIKTGDYVVDVGGEYNLDTKRFDHHQKGGAGQRENGIPYASFGLVWKHFGTQVSGSEEVMKRIDQQLVQPVDAGDNGVKTFNKIIEDVNPYTIGAFFDTYNPSWKNEDNVRINEFMTAVGIARGLLLRIISKEKDFFEADRMVKDIYASCEDKRLIVMDKYYPSNETLCNFPEPLFTVYPQGDGKWVIKAIKDDDESFDYRKYLPKDWSGKTGAELEDVTGVTGANSCHNALFIATAKSREAILKMAEIAINS